MTDSEKSTENNTETKTDNKPLTEEEIKKLKEDRQKMEEQAKEVIQDFLKENGNAVIDATIQYTKQCGLGALFITLTSGSNEADIEYFKVEDLDGGFKKKILENPNKESSVFYAIKLSHYSYIFERNLGEKVEEYVF